MLKSRKKLQKGFANIPFLDVVAASIRFPLLMKQGVRGWLAMPQLPLHLPLHKGEKSAAIPALFFFLVLLFIGCAEHAPAPVQHLPLENPTRFTNLSTGEDYNKAYSDYEKGDLQKARKEFGDELKKNPRHYPSYLGIGYTYLTEKQFTESEKYIRKALELQPDYPQAHFALATVLEQQQNYDGALHELEQTAQTNPDYPSIQESLSVMKLKVTEMHLNEAQKTRDSDPELALQHLKSAQTLAPEIASIPTDIADILIKQDKCPDAIPYLEKAIELSLEKTQPKLQMADCLTEMQEYNQAVSVYEELSAQHPDDNEIRAKLEAARKRVFVQSLPEEYQEIPKAAEITRAQFAALVMVNLEFLQNYSSGTSQILVDTINHWAKNFILKAVDLGVMDPYPNRTFQPDEPLTRLELAKGASRILEIVESNARKEIPAQENPASIPDVPSSNVYYKMIAKAVSAGLLTVDGDGNFHPSRTVSGAEALSLINQIKRIAE